MVHFLLGRIGNYQCRSVRKYSSHLDPKKILEKVEQSSPKNMQTYSRFHGLAWGIVTGTLLLAAAGYKAVSMIIPSKQPTGESTSKA